MFLTSWMLNTAYLLLLCIASPLLCYRALRHGKYLSGWKQKIFGQTPMRESSCQCVWFHAVSVGEVIQLQKLIDHFQAAHPEYEIWITTTTNTGYAVAQERFPKLQVCYFPLDFSWATRNAIARIRPDAIVLVELELWPNFILEATRAGLPVSLINGRVSDSSYRGYRHIRPLVQRLLQRLSVIAVQNPQYAQRLIDLGANAERVHVTGSIKFDHVETDRGNSASQHLKSILNIQEQHQVFVAGSTQSPEEALALDCYQQLQHEFPALRLILVPRHRERFDEVARLVTSRGIPLLRRSGCPDNLLVTGHTPVDRPAENPVILLDTLGELAACWGLADIAFVGGSLTSRGGQNMIEPAGYGAAVLFGPHTHNFRDVVELLLTHHAATVVSNFDQLHDRVQEFLKNPHTAQQVGRVAQQLVLDQQGATEATSQLLSAMLSRQQAPANVRAA